MNTNEMEIVCTCNARAEVKAKGTVAKLPIDMCKDRLEDKLNDIFKRCRDIESVLGELSDRILKVDDEFSDPINMALVTYALKNLNIVKNMARMETNY